MEMVIFSIHGDHDYKEQKNRVEKNWQNYFIKLSKKNFKKSLAACTAG